MNIFSYIFQDKINQRVFGKRTISGSILRKDGSICGHYSMEAFHQNCHLQVFIESSQLQVNIHKSWENSPKLINKLFMPWGKGSIILNGKNIAQYTSYGEIQFKDPQLGFLKVVEDDSARRFLWARAYGCSYGDSSKFSHYRQTLLVSNDAVFASFCGYYERSPFFNKNDENIITNMPSEKQWCIFSLCLIWNVIRPLEGLNERGTFSYNCLGDLIPDIPSFVVLEKDGEKILSIAPEDVKGKVASYDKFLQFINRNCQWYLGLPLLLLSYAFLRDCFEFFVLNMNNVPIGRLWVTGILCLVASILYWRLAFDHGSVKHYRFSLKN